ncbi:hypothetical protein BST27_17395 [Mycobacterium intermedium]|uniref:Uncharacterized protein n=1 Tax=Mycobacterium intermedium TaxID=28445 RepID=A0A1E3S8D2_MYCIE|nr:hypothetical protein BHQ20_22240 [Mycobacterium intermedium]OPE47693.1 hypothetical protein BV508_21165 [Mycobacterium intermedium]ORB01490.1 hypothetical protein BST27_17395 [Mycobacterium intermedium]
MFCTAIAAALGAATTTAGDARGEVTNAAYELGYSQAVAAVQDTATHMRAEGFQLADIVISSRIPALCAREAAQVQGLASGNADFFRGCTDGMMAMVEIGVAY